MRITWMLLFLDSYLFLFFWLFGWLVGCLFGSFIWKSNTACEMHVMFWYVVFHVRWFFSLGAGIYLVFFSTQQNIQKNTQKWNKISGLGPRCTLHTYCVNNATRVTIVNNYASNDLSETKYLGVNVIERKVETMNTRCVVVFSLCLNYFEAANV